MYCKNCGSKLDENASVCMSCGCNPNEGNKFCWNCKNETNENAVVCVSCGANLKLQGTNSTGMLQPKVYGTQPEIALTQEAKSWSTTLLLCIFFGGIGVHRFYTGHTGVGLLMLFTLGCCGILTIIDLIRIITGDFKDSNGHKLQKS